MTAQGADGDPVVVQFLFELLKRCSVDA